MKGRERLLGRLAQWAAGSPGKAVIVAAAITVVMIVGAAFVQMDMTFYSIMPQHIQQVRDLEYITEQYPLASSIIAVVDGRSLGTGPEVTRTVTDTVDALEAEFTRDEWSDAVAGVWGRFDTDFIASHGLVLTKTDDIQRFSDLYADLDVVPLLAALNDDLEREYSGDSDALSSDENLVVSWAGGLSGILDQLANATDGSGIDQAELDAAMQRWLVGDPYYLSRDETMALVFIEPTFTINDVGPLVRNVPHIDERSKEIGSEFGVQVGLTGMIVVGKDEMMTSEQGLVESMAIALILILGLMILVFRMRSVPLITGIPLVVGILWTIGMTGFALGRLNIMTAMYLVALVGLGVDYAVHLLTGFVQERDDGHDFMDAITITFRRAGPGIVTGALTTAAAFYALIVSESEVVRELAIVAGGGILCEFLAMFLLVPAILGIRNRRLEKKGLPDPMMNQKFRIKSTWADSIGRVVARVPVVFLVGLAAIGIGLGTQAGKVVVEDNLMNLEAKGLESVRLQDTLVDEFGAAPDSLYLFANTRDGLSDLAQRLEDLGSVRMVDSIAPWWPSDAEQAARRPLVADLQQQFAAYQVGSSPDADALLDELYRLEQNLVEMGDLAVIGGMDRVAHALNQATGLDMDGNKVADSAFDRLFNRLESAGSDPATAAGLAAFQQSFSPDLSHRLATMANPEPITEDLLPSQVTDSYISRDGSTYLVTITPRQNIWQAEYRNVLTSQVATVTDAATGLVLAADQLTKITQTDGRRAVIAALIAVFVILLIDFRNLRLTIISFIPLGMSFASLFGFMALTGIKLDFINIIAIPLLVGIGVDDTVHINHRYLLEGPGGMQRTLARTGTAVAMTTITTIIGFASFIPSVMRGMRGTGIVLSVAMALAFIFSVFMHPAVLKIAVENWHWNLSPRIGRRPDSTEVSP